MNNILIIGAGEGMGKALTEGLSNFDQIYTISRKEDFCVDGTIHIQSDASKSIEVNTIDNDSLDLVIYIPSLWGTDSEMSETEFDDYMAVGPKGFLKSFNTLRENSKLKDNALVVSIGSTASETALQISDNPSSSIYSLAKLTQKSLVIQLMQKYKQYRFLNFTLGSIGDDDGGVGYSNIVNTINHIYTMKNGVRYSEVTLASEVDVY